MTRRPPFVKALTDDIGRLGALEADILAVIRFVTNVTNVKAAGDDRVVIDDRVCWRVSHKDIGEALGGVSRQVVGRAVRHLEDSAELVSYEIADDVQKKAYRVAEQPEFDSEHVESSQSSEMNRPSSEMNTACSETNRYVFGNEHSSSIKEVEEEKKGEEGPPLPALIDDEVIDAELIEREEIPSKYCPLHPEGTPTPCHGCKLARERQKEVIGRRAARTLAEHHAKGRPR